MDLERLPSGIQLYISKLLLRERKYNFNLLQN